MKYKSYNAWACCDIFLDPFLIYVHFWLKHLEELYEYLLNIGLVFCHYISLPGASFIFITISRTTAATTTTTTTTKTTHIPLHYHLLISIPYISVRDRTTCISLCFTLAPVQYFHISAIQG
jgi:hypothetical protein